MTMLRTPLEEALHWRCPRHKNWADGCDICRRVAFKIATAARRAADPTEYSAHDAHEVTQLERGRPLKLSEVRCLIADHQTPIRHGTAAPIYEAAEMLLRMLDGDRA